MLTPTIARQFLTLLPTLALVACSGTAVDRVLPIITEEDGVEISTLPELPSLLDEAYLWDTRVIREYRTTANDNPTAEPFIYEPGAALPLSGDRLLVTDRYADPKYVMLDLEDGSVVARFGRSGQGPGELSDRVTVTEADGILWILDRDNRQIHKFGLDGQWLGSTPLEYSEYALKTLSKPGVGTFLVEIFTLNQRDPSPNRIGRVDARTGSLNVLTQLSDWPPNGGLGDITRGRPLWTIVESGFVTMRVDRLAFEVFDWNGQRVREIRHGLSRRWHGREEIQTEVEKYGGIAAGQTPGRIAITNLLYSVSDTVFAMYQSGRWRAAEDPELPEGRTIWRMFSVSGAYMGALFIPEDFNIISQGDGTLWGTALDERGVPVIQERELVVPPALRH